MKKLLLFVTIALFMSHATCRGQSLLNQVKKQGTSQKKTNTAGTTAKKSTANAGTSAAKPKATTTTTNAAKPRTAPKQSASSEATIPSYVNIGKGDLPLFDLHGPVKSVKMSMDFGDGTFGFDRNGKWTLWDGEAIKNLGVSRNSRGQVDFVPNGSNYCFWYAQGGLLQKSSITETQYETSFTYSYDASGNMTQYTMSSVCSNKRKTSETVKVTILQRDAYGNWLKRKTGNYTETRTIDFYDMSEGSSTYSNTDKVYDVADPMPSFPGGMGALMQYLSSHIKYPVKAEEDGIQGRVLCTFIIEKDGSISDIRVSRSIHQTLDDEAVRVIGAMPKWTPGKVNGMTCRTWFTLPVTFKLR